MSKSSLSLEELLEIGRKYKENITSIKAWEKYRSNNNMELPHAQTFISRFGSWNKFKSELDLPQNEQMRPVKYSEDYLQSILARYGEHFTSATNWNTFAKANQLPQYHVFSKRLGADILYEKTGYLSEWTVEKLKHVITKHFPDQPPTVAEWTALGGTTIIPSYQTIIRCYGSWNTMKHHVYYK